jgi:hypothetical protein
MLGHEEQVAQKARSVDPIQSLCLMCQQLQLGRKEEQQH